MESFDKVKLVISDCHLSAGRYFESRVNPHEDFHFDDELCDLIKYFSSGKYGSKGDQPIEVELVLAGDFFDFLNVPIRGEFEDAVTEELALFKLRAILKGHPKVSAAIRKFASLPGKTVTYLIGNHDADLFFPKIREEITRAWDPDGEFPSQKVRVLADTDRLSYPEGVEIRHGCQDDLGSELNYQKPIVRSVRGLDLLNMPWSSIYVLKIINRLRWEREHIDKIRPVIAFIIVGLIFDPLFTIRFSFLSLFYLIRTRVLTWNNRLTGIGKFIKTFREQVQFFQDLDRAARRILDESPHLQTIIMGHTHRPMNKIYADGKQYINTGTWTKMIDLDWRGIGQQIRRTFALVHIYEGKAHCELHQWMGEHSPHKLFYN